MSKITKVTIKQAKELVKLFKWVRQIASAFDLIITGEETARVWYNLAVGI